MYRLLENNWLLHSKSLFKDPAKKDFTIVDAAFSGRKTAGDPRWR